MKFELFKKYLMRKSRSNLATKSLRDPKRRGKDLGKFTLFKGISNRLSNNKKDSSKKHKKSKYLIFFKRFFIAASFITLVGVLAGCIAVAIWVGDVSKSLNGIDPDKPFQTVGTEGDTYIYSQDGVELRRLFGLESKDFIKIDDVPDSVKAAFVSIEDKSFFENKGFDPIGLVRAMFTTVTDKAQQGGSTITQQVVKVNLVGPEKSINRKLKELILSVQITQRYSKDQILQLYLNSISFGGNLIGVKRAAKEYFNKEVKDLTYGEAAVLAGIPNQPTRLAPRADKDNSMKLENRPELATDDYYDKLSDGSYIPGNINRALLVLDKMDEASDALIRYPGLKIEKEKIIKAKDEKIVFNFAKTEFKAPHFTINGGVVNQELKRILKEIYPDKTDTAIDTIISSGGLRVYTTLDYGMQQLGETEIKKVDKDAKLDAKNASLITVETKSGAIKAYVGSIDFNSVDPKVKGQVDILRQGRSQGSTMKPLTYLTGMVYKGFAPSTVWPDIPIDFGNYRPQNYFKGQFAGLGMNSYDALKRSLNLPALQALVGVGTDKYAELLGKMGYNEREQAEVKGSITSTLGSAGISPLSHAKAYQTLFNGGVKKELYAVERITDREGKQIFQKANDNGVKIVDERHAWLVFDIIRNYSTVVNTGFSKQGYDAAGKTGTYDGGKNGEVTDVAFWGGTPNVITGVWAGNSDYTPIANKATGEQLGSTIWANYMKQILPKYPKDKFVKPAGIVTRTICTDTGYLASDDNPCPKGPALFVEGQLPKDDKNHVKAIVVDCAGVLKLASKADILAGVSREQVFVKYETNTGNASIQKQIDEYAKAKGMPPVPTEVCNDPRTPDGTIFTKFVSPPAGTVYNTGDVIKMTIDTVVDNPSVTYYFDNTVIAGFKSLSAEFTIPVGTNGGDHTLKAVVTAADGRTGQTTLSIRVNPDSVVTPTPPVGLTNVTVQVTSPANAGTVAKGTLAVKALVTDPDNMVKSVSFYGKKATDSSFTLIGSTISHTGGVYGVNWNLSSGTPGLYEIYAVASDGTSQKDSIHNTFTLTP